MAMRPRVSSPIPLYCSYDTGLDRGFTHYEDYVLEQARSASDGRPGRRSPEDVALHGWTLRHDRRRPLHSLQEFVQAGSTSVVARDAGSINREFLDWLTDGTSQRRPFFAFLNYFDAHSPYMLPDGAEHRFGRKPETQDDFRIIYELGATIDKSRLPQHYLTLARDCYDNCLAYLDERLGELFDELQRRGVLDRTLVIITADHGEGLGEHDLFDHGESLYSTEIRVPLLILPPSGSQSGGVVRETVSLRDLPATIVDLVGLGTGSPFPGRSLASLWRDSLAGAVRAAAMERSPSCRVPIPPIRIKVDRPLAAAR